MAAKRRKKPGQEIGPALDDQSAPHLRRMPVIDAALEKAVTIPSATIHAHVQSLRRRNPYASPAQIIGLLEREYLFVLAGAGGAVGAAAAAPSIGTGVAMALTASDVATFFASSAAFALAVASVHGIEVQDTGRRRALLLGTIVGESAALAGTEAEISSGAFARAVLTRMPTSTIARVNRVLTQRMVRRQAVRQGALAFGRLAPFGIGALIGVTGARALGRTVIMGARHAFGPPPLHFPQLVEVIETGDVPRVIPASGQPPFPHDPGRTAGNGLRH
jgi:hypothetical protein